MHEAFLLCLLKQLAWCGLRGLCSGLLFQTFGYAGALCLRCLSRIGQLGILDFDGWRGVFWIKRNDCVFCVGAQKA